MGSRPPSHQSHLCRPVVRPSHLSHNGRVLRPQKNVCQERQQGIVTMSTTTQSKPPRGIGAREIGDGAPSDTTKSQRAPGATTPSLAGVKTWRGKHVAAQHQTKKGNLECPNGYRRETQKYFFDHKNRSRSPDWPSTMPQKCHEPPIERRSRAHTKSYVHSSQPATKKTKAKPRNKSEFPQQGTTMKHRIAQATPHT